MARLPADLLPCFREESQELTWREIASSTFTRRVRRSAAISVRLTSRVSCQIRHMHRQNVNPSGESGVVAVKMLRISREDDLPSERVRAGHHLSAVEQYCPERHLHPGPRDI